MSDEFQEPFYVHRCPDLQEDNARHIILHQYVACLRISNEWAVPTDPESTWLDIPAVVDVLPGVCLFNPAYGYFRIASFDKQAQKVLVQRVPSTLTASPGTVVPGCTKFILTPEP